MNRISFGAAALLIGLAIPITSHATITRGCKANFQVVVTAHSGRYDHGRGVGIIDDFEGVGQCGNKAKANSCRERARNAIFGCAKDYWAQRGGSVLPIKCKPGRGSLGVRGLGPFQPNKRNRSRYDLRFAIEYTACCKLQPRADALTVDVKAISHGDKGCGKDKNMGSVGSGKYMQTYMMGRGFKANCKRLRANGWCS